MHEVDPDDRSARAFRAAVESLRAESRLDPSAIRRQVGRRRAAGATLGGATLLAVVLAVVLGWPLAGRTAHVANPAPMEAPPVAPKDPAPEGWRTEYYRTISFVVPAAWGHQVEPASDWCADTPDGRPADRHRRPYVSLGQQQTVRELLCPPLPTSMLTQHVVVFPYPAAAEPLDGVRREGSWFIAQRVFADVVIQATSKDRDLAERIVDSAQPAPAAAPCRASHPVQGELGPRPAPAFRLEDLTGVQAAMVCQYDPDDLTGNVAGGLRAAVDIPRGVLDALLSTLVAAPPNRTTTCDPAPERDQPEVAAVVRLQTADGAREVYVQAAGCPGGSQVLGGIDDGTTVRLLSRRACQAIPLVPPAVSAGSAPVVSACFR